MIKNSLILLSILFAALACGGKNETEILYSEYDSEYSDIQAFAERECISNATIFDVFDTVGEFDDSVFEVGDIFQVVQDSDDAVISFLQITAIGANDMTVTMISDNSNYSKILTFEETDHDSIIDFLKEAACNKDAEDYFSTSGLTSSSTMSFEWSKETVLVVDDSDDDSTPEAYKYVDESLSVSTKYPLFMFFLNGTKSQEYILTDGGDKVTKTSKLTITEISQDTCDDHSVCDGIALGEVTRNCAIEVDDTVYSTRDYSTTPLKFDAGSDADCKFLESAGIGTWTN